MQQHSWKSDLALNDRAGSFGVLILWLQQQQPLTLSSADDGVVATVLLLCFLSKRMTSSVHHRKGSKTSESDPRTLN
jgi:hypothetical protein